MRHWIPGVVTLACDELKEKLPGKKVALMINTTAMGNEGRLLVESQAAHSHNGGSE